MPMVSKFALTAGSRRAVTVTMWILSTIAGDVLPGTKNANHPVTSKPGTPPLRNARQVRCPLAALGGSHRQCAKLAASDVLKHRAAAHLQVTPPGARIRERGSIAPIGYVRHLDACDLLEQLARQVRHGPNPGRGERDLALFVSGECDEFRDRSRGR